MNEWRLINLETHNGFSNMAIDEAILNARIRNEVPNTVRFYRWNPSTVSIGKNQSISAEANIEMCKNHGVDIVRRITGGGAVYHDYEGEITYSVIVKQEQDIPFETDLSFIKLCTGIIIALNKIGLNAYQGKHHCPSIFIDERKISGNAQTRRKGVILQHGTILRDYDPELMYTFLRVREGIKKEKVVHSVYQKITTIKRELKTQVDFSELERILKESFEESFKTKFLEIGLTNSEKFEAERLEKEKFNTKEWIFKID
ncbi:MAG: lipoate--protein ligase family protein [Candidatus Lokiarchaeota archaeon]|nr:lipoate--protein ligase family protein [Candidatus Lokiarchaeota archaeon]